MEDQPTLCDLIFLIASMVGRYDYLHGMHCQGDDAVFHQLGYELVVFMGHGPSLLLPRRPIFHQLVEPLLPVKVCMFATSVKCTWAHILRKEWM